MTALKPIENRRVRGVPSERYPLNEKCAHPECNEPVVDPHHTFPRSQIKNDSWFVEIVFETPLSMPLTNGTPVELPNGAEGVLTIIPHVAGLCRAHHDDVEQHRAWIKLEEGVFVWYVGLPDEVDRKMDWVSLGPLNPQPGSREGKPKRKRFAGAKRRKRQVIGIRVPQDAEEEGAGLLDDAMAQVEQLLGFDEPRPGYYTIMDALQIASLELQNPEQKKGGKSGS